MYEETLEFDLSDIDIEMSVDDLEGTAKRIEKLVKILDSEELLEYIKEKILETLNKVTQENLNTDVNEEYVHSYRNNNTISREGNVITISNETTLNPSQLSDNIKDNYPNGFDVSKAVEFGTGVTGANSDGKSQAGKFGWEYDVNNHGEQGWYYSINGNVYWTKGMSGKLIYYKTTQEVKDNYQSWINDYIKDKL